MINKKSSRKDFRTFVTRIAFGATALSVLLCAPAVSKAADNHEERCEAYETLAKCDLEDCAAACRNRYPEGNEICETRCTRRYRRAFRVPNRRYDCESPEPCDEERFLKRLDEKLIAYELCVAKADILGKPQEEIVACRTRYDRQIERQCSIAELNHCDHPIILAICD